MCSISHAQMIGTNSIQFKLKQVKGISKLYNVCGQPKWVDGYFLTKLSRSLLPLNAICGDSFKFPLVAVSTIDKPCLCFVVKRFHMNVWRKWVCLLLLVSTSNKLWNYACPYKNNLFKSQETCRLTKQIHIHTFGMNFLQSTIAWITWLYTHVLTNNSSFERFLWMWVIL